MFSTPQKDISSIQAALEERYTALISFLKQQDPGDFLMEKIPNKWSAGQHAEHLILSTKPLNKALRTPKFVLKTTFGVKNERPERSFNEVVEKYKSRLAAGGRATGAYIPKPIQKDQKTALLKNLEKELVQLQSVCNKWNEAQMSKYLLPHPLLGKMTIREILFFTIYHTEHHLNAIHELSQASPNPPLS